MATPSAVASPESQPTPSIKQTPPVEVVLPAIYYLVLALEAVALTILFQLHPISASTDIGRAIGWTGTMSMILMHIYSIRRRVRAFNKWGRLRTWLHVHIFLGLQGGMFVTFHSLHLTTWRNIAGFTEICTLTVVLSGLFGRYLFAFIPKNLSGERLTARQVEEELTQLSTMVKQRRSQDPGEHSILAELSNARAVPGSKRTSFLNLIIVDLRTRREIWKLDRALKQAQGGSGPLPFYAQAERRKLFLTRRLATLTAAERLFRNWTILHKPLTFILAGSVVLHIVSHYIFAGYSSGMSGG